MFTILIENTKHTTHDIRSHNIFTMLWNHHSLFIPQTFSSSTTEALYPQTVSLLLVCFLIIRDSTYT